MGVSLDSIETLSARAAELYDLTKRLLRLVRSATPSVCWVRQPDGSFRGMYLYGAGPKTAAADREYRQALRCDDFPDRGRVLARYRRQSDRLTSDDSAREKARGEGEKARTEAVALAARVKAVVEDSRRLDEPLLILEEAATGEVPPIRWYRKVCNSAHLLVMSVAEHYAGEVQRHLAAPPEGEDGLNRPWSGRFADRELSPENQYGVPLGIEFTIQDRTESFELSTFEERLAKERGYALRYIRSLPASAARPDVPPAKPATPPPTIVWLGEQVYQMSDGARPFTMSESEHVVLQAFLRSGHGCFDKPTLEAACSAPKGAAPVDDPTHVLRDLASAKRYGGVFAMAIDCPGGKGQGGYHVRIRAESTP